MLPVFSMLVAGAALALGAVAIATDDVSMDTPQPSPVVVTPAAEECVFPNPGVIVRC
jgi:hypothetical protein